MTGNPSLTTDDYRRAMTLADQHGMRLVPSPSDPELGRLRCKACGWPSGDQYDTRIRQFLAEPHGCVCGGEATEAERLGEQA